MDCGSNSELATSASYFFLGGGGFSRGEQEKKQFSWFRTDYLYAPNGTGVMERTFSALNISVWSWWSEVPSGRSWNLLVRQSNKPFQMMCFRLCGGERKETERWRERSKICMKVVL